MSDLTFKYFSSERAVDILNRVYEIEDSMVEIYLLSLEIESFIKEISKKHCE